MYTSLQGYMYTFIYIRIESPIKISENVEKFLKKKKREPNYAVDIAELARITESHYSITE